MSEGRDPHQGHSHFPLPKFIPHYGDDDDDDDDDDEDDDDDDDEDNVGSSANSSVGEVVYSHNFSAKSKPKNSPFSKGNYSKRIFKSSWNSTIHDIR
ncbi:hypothetical protein ElyMa_003462300 [Elysia marginata]|uniref:Uncharacterized protein n=1 Tax=Elysia marginata TaxID=1093978 RepID=A0AAV4E9K7_9GAST|nr:hypothetical protein ElyMa_003462300 [Elysia marginata]